MQAVLAERDTRAESLNRILNILTPQERQAITTATTPRRQAYEFAKAISKNPQALRLYLSIR